MQKNRKSLHNQDYKGLLCQDNLSSPSLPNIFTTLILNYSHHFFSFFPGHKFSEYYRWKFVLNTNKTKKHVFSLYIYIYIPKMRERYQDRESGETLRELNYRNGIKGGRQLKRCSFFMIWVNLWCFSNLKIEIED